jgi:hypothetical protein
MSLADRLAFEPTLDALGDAKSTPLVPELTEAWWTALPRLTFARVDRAIRRAMSESSFWPGRPSRSSRRRSRTIASRPPLIATEVLSTSAPTAETPGSCSPCGAPAAAVPASSPARAHAHSGAARWLLGRNRTSRVAHSWTRHARTRADSTGSRPSPRARHRPGANEHHVGIGRFGGIAPALSTGGHAPPRTTLARKGHP